MAWRNRPIPLRVPNTDGLASNMSQLHCWGLPCLSEYAIWIQAINRPHEVGYFPAGLTSWRNRSIPPCAPQFQRGMLPGDQLMTSIDRVEYQNITQVANTQPVKNSLSVCLVQMLANRRPNERPNTLSRRRSNCLVPKGPVTRWLLDLLLPETAVPWYVGGRWCV